MATRGWEDLTESDVRKFDRRTKAIAAEPMRSKYRNVKCVVGQEMFDSKHEAECWLILQAKQAAGEISDLHRQVPFALHCPSFTDQHLMMEVAHYVADFTWRVQGQLHVGDAKSKATKTQIYERSKKHMRLEHGLEIEEL
jgi:hypothetical protein